MNGIFHLVAALMLGLLIWWWSEEKTKNKLIMDLLKQFTEYQSQKHLEPSVKSPQKVYLKRPLEFVTTLCQCFGIPHEIDSQGGPTAKHGEIATLNQITKINPVPLVGFLLFHQVHKMASHISPDQMPNLTIWVRSGDFDAEQTQILKTALGGALEVSLVYQDKASEKS